MIFRAFWGEPVPEARELEDGHLHHAEAPVQPGQRRDRGHRRRLPRARAPHRRAGAADEGRDGRARGAGRSSAASCSGPVGRRRGSRRSSSRRSPTPRSHLEPDRRARRRSASCSARCSGWPASPSPTASGCVQPGHERARPASASRRCTGSSSTSGTSTSSSTSLVVRPCGVARALRPADLRARGRQRRASSAGRPGIVRPARPPCARAAERLPARLRRAARARHRRASASTSCSRALTMNLSILLWLPLAARHRGARAARRRGALRGAAGLGWRRSCSPIVLLVRLRRRPARAAVRHRQDVDQRARHPLQARRRRAEPLPRSRSRRCCSSPAIAVGGAARVGAPAAVLLLVRPGRERRARRAAWPRTSRCSSSSST